jgi:hypothetical protein
MPCPYTLLSHFPRGVDGCSITWRNCRKTNSRPQDNNSRSRPQQVPADSQCFYGFGLRYRQCQGLGKRTSCHCTILCSIAVNLSDSRETPQLGSNSGRDRLSEACILLGLATRLSSVRKVLRSPLSDTSASWIPIENIGERQNPQRSVEAPIKTVA